MKTCPICQNSYPDTYSVCPNDGTALPGIWSEGSVIRGKYQIIAKVGQGGMGAVYKALHQAFNEFRALKVIAPELMSDDLFVKRFTHEAVITRRLQHPNAVRVDDIDKAEDGRPYIVMEFIDGKSLKKLIREEGPLPVLRVLSIIRQSASALDAAHKLGMVHRDIKPDNIALIDSPEGEMVKVLDFGIAKVKEARLGDNAGLTLTGAGVVIGTPQYMSPEQAMGKRGDELDGRADLYSLGVVMYQMLSADLPFKADTTMEMLLAHMQKPPAPLELLHPELQIPKPVAALTMRLLEKNRDLRPATGRVLMQEIEKLERELALTKTRVVTDEELNRLNQGGGGGSVSPPWPPSPLPPPPPPPRPQDDRKVAPKPPPRPQPSDDNLRVTPPPADSKWGLWIALIVLLLGLGGGLYYFATRPKPQPLTVTAVLTADPGTVEQGGSVMLHWNAQNATDIDIEPSPGKVQQSEGVTQVSPQQSTTYTLTASNANGSTQSTAFVSVTSPVVHHDIPVQDNTTQTTKPEVETTVTHEHLGFKIPRHEEPSKPKVDIRAVQSSITLGNFHFDRGEYDEAIASYQKGLELDPSNSSLRQKLRTAISACRTENATLNETNKCGSR